MKALILSLLTAFAALVAATAAAGGGTYTCTGAVGDPGGLIPPSPTTIDANVDVPAGAFCSMLVVTVTGNVTVEGTLSGLGNTFEKNVTVNGGNVGFAVCFSLLCGPLGGNRVAGNLTIEKLGLGPERGREGVDREELDLLEQ
jgi:hypothetical protein